MSSASNGRKNRPRSAGNIFQIGKPPCRDPERRESTESTRKAQRAVADCRMVGLRHGNAFHGASGNKDVISTTVLCFRPPTIPCTQRMHRRQLLLAETNKKRRENRIVTRCESLKIDICICIALSTVKAKGSSLSACRVIAIRIWSVWDFPNCPK